ncbi:hypothetical protein LWI29_036468 [Acer saccharum]|uniref:Transmembrane protein n=1 Tax=Acer saccharum TaxID=4024 RepID=A0AA39TC32_ACESA|nr:hypothetical protein LWI29_036468 [Acer saccharum]
MNSRSFPLIRLTGLRVSIVVKLKVNVLLELEWEEWWWWCPLFLSLICINQVFGSLIFVAESCNTCFKGFLFCDFFHVW